RVLSFPLSAVDGRDGQRLDRLSIDAPCVHTDAVRMRAWHIKGFDAAHRTEEMPGRVRVEGVCSQEFAPAQQPEPVRRHDEMQVTGLAAHRTVAVRYAQLPRGDDFEANPPAVTTAAVRDHCAHAPRSPVSSEVEDVDTLNVRPHSDMPSRSAGNRLSIATDCLEPPALKPIESSARMPS